MSAPGRDQLAVLSIVKMHDMQHTHTNMHHVCIQYIYIAYYYIMYHSHLLGITLDYSRHWLLVILREISVEAYDVLGDSQQRKAYDAERADFHRRPETSQGRQAGMRSQRGGGEVEEKGSLLNHILILYTEKR